MEVVYKPITQNHVEEYYKLVNEIKDEGKYLFSTLRFPIEETHKYVSQHENNNCPIIGAFITDCLIGWIDYNRGGFEEISHTAGIGMGVKLEYRGKGIGKKLLLKCIESATSNNIEKLELEVFSTNKVAYDLYKKIGFIEEGRRIKKRRFNGQYEDLIQMGLFL